MDKIRAMIRATIAKVMQAGTSEDQLREFNDMDCEYKAIYILNRDNVDIKERLKEVQDTLRKVGEYDARSMTLIQFIKMKVTRMKEGYQWLD